MMMPCCTPLVGGFHLSEDFAYGQISNPSILRFYGSTRTLGMTVYSHQFFLFLSRTILSSLHFT
jgi:hypothetical protein